MDLISHHEYFSAHDPTLKSNGCHTETVDGTELKIAEGKVASTDTTAAQNFRQEAVFIGHNY